MYTDPQLDPLGSLLVEIREDADVDARARAMIALVQGFAAQMALLGDIPPQVLADGTRALMNVAPGQ